MIPKTQIRNFCIIAHIDHGKSTLADRLLELTGTISDKDKNLQVLDSMELERERGITIKAHAIRMFYKARDGKEYMLNLIDTPGHVDFTYEVSRSMAACEGGLLIVDASQGIEAQTIANLYLAIENNLTVIPVINKIDLPNAQIKETTAQVIDILGVSESEILLVSAKHGNGVPEVLEQIVNRISPPTELDTMPLRALIFDSVFDSYRGAIAYVRVMEGILKQHMEVRFFSTGKEYEADEVGYLQLRRFKQDQLTAGEVGYLITGAKDAGEVHVGDTIVEAGLTGTAPLPGYKEPHPMVFAGFYPAMSENFEDLKNALVRLRLNDASVHYEPETSSALGFGYRCGFLGLLHKEIIQERLEREYGLNIVTTIPNVAYRILKTNGEEEEVDNPADLPDSQSLVKILEPYVMAQIVTPPEYIGAIMKLTMDRRGIQEKTESLGSNSLILHYSLPLAEIIFDFYDKLKSSTRGYASFDYEFNEYRQSDVVKLNILINGESVDALSIIVHRDKAYDWGRKVCTKLKDIIPRQLYEVAIQGAIGGRIIARESVKALRKNVTAKCYGGDITRKRKLLEKQKEGKKRMKQVGKVEIPQEAFLALLQVD